MKLYKDINNKLFGFAADGSQDHIKPDGLIEITKAELDAINEQKAQDKFNALDYSAKRQTAYPSMTDYLDAWVKQDDAALEAYRATCLAVKAKYPKV
jgi:hypothetical protein